MHALLAALALTAVPSRASAADDPLALTLAATSGGCRGDEQGAARLVCASRQAQGAVEALELFRARAASAEDRNKAAALVAPELAPFFRDRDSALDALYRTLAVLDDSRVLAAGNDSCSARARRAVLLGSSDGLFADPRTGRASAWLTRLLGPEAAERSAASALDAAAGTPLADADYERLRARARELSRRILQNGADRSALCERARAYTALASAHRFARLTPAGRETSAATDPAASVLLLVRLRAGGYDALGAAVAVDGPRGPRLLTDARLVLDPATGHALTDLATVRLDEGKLSAPAPWTPARADASAGLAEGPVPDGVPALALAEGAPRERDLVSAIGQSGASSLWGRTQGLVSRVGGDWFATDAAVDVGMTGAAVLNADGRLAGVLVLRAARTTDERRLDWPAAVSAPALRRWLSGDALAAPAGPLDVAGLGTASIAGGAFIDASTSWNEGCGGVGTYIPELNQTIHATCAADCDCSSPSPSPQPSSPAPQAAPSAPAGPDYAQQFGAQMGQMMGQYLGNMIGQALFGGGGAAAAPPQAPAPVPRAPAPPPKSERPQDERKIIGLKLTLDPPDPQPGQTATLTAQLLFNGDDYEDKANVDIDLSAPETGEARFLDPMAGADDDGQKSVSLQTDADGKAVVKLKVTALHTGEPRRSRARESTAETSPSNSGGSTDVLAAAGVSGGVPSVPVAIMTSIVIHGAADTNNGRFNDKLTIVECPQGQKPNPRKNKARAAAGGAANPGTPTPPQPGNPGSPPSSAPACAHNMDDCYRFYAHYAHALFDCANAVKTGDYCRSTGSPSAPGGASHGGGAVPSEGYFANGAQPEEEPDCIADDSNSEQQAIKPQNKNDSKGESSEEENEPGSDKNTIHDIGLREKIEESGMTTKEAGKFFGWEANGQITKSVSDFDRATLESNGWNETTLDDVASAYEKVNEITPKNKSALPRAQQLRALISTYFK